MARTASELMTQSIRQHGAQFMRKGGGLTRDFPRLPSGIFPFDYMLAGGIPAGVASCLYGPPGGGKSLVAQKIVACAQKLCFKCFEYEWDCTCEHGPTKKDVVWVATEIFDIEWAQCLGIDPDHIYVVEPDYAEAAGDAISGALEAEDIGLVVLDSIGMLTPLTEIEKSFNDAIVGAHAKVVSRLLRVAEARLIKEKKRGNITTFLAINHIRAKIGQSFGFAPAEDVPGGWLAKHAWHFSARMSQLSNQDSNAKDSDTDMTVNAKFRASTIALSNKRKLFMLEGACDFFVTMKDSGEFIAGTVPDWKTVEKKAEEIDFISRGPWSVLGREFGTKKELVEAVMNDDQLYLSIRKKLIEEYRNMAKMEMGM